MRWSGFVSCPEGARCPVCVFRLSSATRTCSASGYHSSTSARFCCAKSVAVRRSVTTTCRPAPNLRRHEPCRVANALRAANRRAAELHHEGPLETLEGFIRHRVLPPPHFPVRRRKQKQRGTVRPLLPGSMECTVPRSERRTTTRTGAGSRRHRRRDGHENRRAHLHGTCSLSLPRWYQQGYRFVKRGKRGCLPPSPYSAKPLFLLPRKMHQTKTYVV